VTFSKLGQVDILRVLGPGETREGWMNVGDKVTLVELELTKEQYLQRQKNG
jgi:hypothetical protein